MKILELVQEKWKQLLLMLVICSLTLIIIAVVLDRIVMPIIVRHGDEVQVPDITLMSQQAAMIKLEESDLDITVALEEYNADNPKGTVIAQLPESGAMVKRGMKIRVTISKGAASATVPKLRGVSLREAKLMLEQEGLVMGDLLWYTDDVLPDGVIIESRPENGTVMKLNAEVQLVVNRKQTDIKIAVPDFVGLDYSEAEQLAEEHYLIIGDISYKVDDRMLPETILYQSVPPGTEVSKWSIVNLTISQLE